jgi:hypothetical protein
MFIPIVVVGWSGACVVVSLQYELERVVMANEHHMVAQSWATAIAESYAASARPPLSPQLRVDLRDHLMEGLIEVVILRIPPSTWGDGVNSDLDDFEAVNHTRGPRLLGIDEARGEVIMRERAHD